MPHIEVLSNETIDKIAAGEVVERPFNVVKELVENSIDAGSTAITVEIKGGGSELIRITDNGCGIPADECKKAFLRHATSKITSINDLETLSSLGFRGEALSSICAVSKTEMITKTADSLLGTRIVIEGGKLFEQSEIGAPNGTTFLIRQLFFNTPARRKFLKTPAAEGAMIEDLIQKLALSHPDISFQLILNGKNKLATSGNGALKDVIYNIFGKEVYSSLLPVSFSNEHISIEGFTAKPEFSYQARNGELFFVNGRYVQSKIVRVAIEQVYSKYLMQHRFPFCVLSLTLPGDAIDINVHPQKMEVKFSDNIIVADAVMDALNKAFEQRELIPSASLSDTDSMVSNEKDDKDEVHESTGPQANEQKHHFGNYTVNSKVLNTVAKDKPVSLGTYVKPEAFTVSFLGEDTVQYEVKPVKEIQYDNADSLSTVRKTIEEKDTESQDAGTTESAEKAGEPFAKQASCSGTEKLPEIFESKRFSERVFEEAPIPVQESLFDKKLISDEPIKRYTIIGQVFDTYWIITLDDDMYLVDQHAAHEKVNYENFVKQYDSEEKAPCQYMDPPIVIHLSALEEVAMQQYMPIFEKIGYELEEFGQGSYALRAVPMNLYGNFEETLFHGLMNELMEKDITLRPQIVLEKLASMSCKAAIKGGQKISSYEMQNLMQQLMSLENPYHCPHGRPVFIKITKNELEKKFKRIV